MTPGKLTRMSQQEEAEMLALSLLSRTIADYVRAAEAAGVANPLQRLYGSIRHGQWRIESRVETLAERKDNH